jgi:hypothetical protein
METSMTKILITLQTALLLLCLAVGHAAWADDAADPYYGTETQYSDGQFSMEELEDLVAPIALYPDPLIAQILPAATFVDQIDEAARYVREYGRYARVDRQYWDVSVKAVAHYPDVLFMMDQKYDWTVSLGQAFVNQNDDVMYAIQLLRQDARAAGNLVSTPQQQVIVDNGYIRIIPAESQVIYVPVYDPQVVYIERPSPGFGLVTFGAGLSIGAWLNRDCDWRDRKVFYHGWRGRDWVNRARPHMQIQNNIYINKTNTVININKKVMQHDTARYREKIRQDVNIRRERHELPDNVRRDRQLREKQKPGGKPVPGAGTQPRPDMHRNQRLPEKTLPPGGKPVPGPGAQPRPDMRREQRLPEKTLPPGGKPAPVITNQQPRTPSPAHDQQPREKSDNRGERQGQIPGQVPRPGTPTDKQQPRTRIDTRREQQGPSSAPSRPVTQPAPRDIYRGRDTQNTQPASRSGYGGYGTNRDATIYRERGKASQESIRPPARPAPAQPKPSVPQQAPPRRAVPAQPPVQRPAPAPRHAPAPAPHKEPAPKHDEKEPGK